MASDIVKSLIALLFLVVGGAIFVVVFTVSTIFAILTAVMQVLGDGVINSYKTIVRFIDGKK